MLPEVRKTKAYYDTHAEEWMARKANAFVHEAQFRDFVRYLKLKAKVLDIGCAGGVLVPLFLGIGRSLGYYGIDISPALLRIAKKRYPHLVFEKGNIADVSTLPKKKSDAFVLAAVLMHLPFSEWNVACTNIEKLMRKGAFGYIVLPTDTVAYEDDSEDTRHFTLLSEEKQLEFFKSRKWKIKKKYKVENHRGNWIGYIVKLP